MDTRKNPTVVYTIFTQSSRSLSVLVTILARFSGNLVDFKGVKTVKQKKKSIIPNQVYTALLTGIIMSSDDHSLDGLLSSTDAKVLGR